MTEFEAFTAALQRLEWVGRLLARLSVGLLFFLSGRGKLFVPARREQMRETIRQAGLPRPELTAPVMALVEFGAGAALILGLLMPLACVMLIGVMAGALITIQIPGIKASSLLDWAGEFLYLPEVLYVVILVWLLFAGPGWPSVDHLWTQSTVPMR
jgi:putative oxidoreductase